MCFRCQAGPASDAKSVVAVRQQHGAEALQHRVGGEHLQLCLGGSCEVGAYSAGGEGCKDGDSGEKMSE